MTHDHELDRRYHDQAFKLDITKQITEIKTELTNNTDKTKEIKNKLDSLEANMSAALNGSLTVPGLIEQAHHGSRQIEGLRKQIFYGLPIMLLVVFFFGEQLNPIVKDWLYEKTHLKIFHSVDEGFKQEKTARRTQRKS